MGVAGRAASHWNRKTEMKRDGGIRRTPKMKQVMGYWYGRWRDSLAQVHWNVNLVEWWRNLDSNTGPARPALRVKSFRAVTIVPCERPCEEALRLSSRRLLARSAPFLPLRYCEFADSCACTYRKFLDRRRGADRRHAAFLKSGQAERRFSSPGRRTADTH